MPVKQHHLLLIHGFPLDHTLWQPNMEALEHVAQVMAPDLLAFESAEAVPEVLTMEHLADQLKAQLDANGIQRTVLCGLSMGGYVALAFLERWPERVSGIILCNTRSIADTEEAKEGREATALDVLAKGSEVIARAMVPKLLSEKTRSTVPELAKTVEAMIARQRPEAIAAASRGMALRPDRTHVLRESDTPTLIITGENDALMPLATSEAMATAAPRSTLVVLPEAGHLSNMEAPDGFNSAVVDFLRTLSGA
ncbi:MAG: alpha/beta fold hydrolase [Flavobacteriales bacterium]